MIVITFICAIATLLVIVIIGYLQIKHNKVDEKNMQLNNEQEANKFIEKYESLYDFIPLAVIAYFYNNNIKYKRDIYNDFRKLNNVEKEQVIDYFCPDLKLKTFDDFYGLCLNTLIECIDKNELDKDANCIYYDNGKYLRYAIEKYPNLKTDFIKSGYGNDIDLIFKNSDCPIYEMRLKYTFDGMVKQVEKGELVAFLACQIAKLVAIYNSHNNNQKQYGEVEGKNITLMKLEDEFLLSLYYIYTCLVMKD